MNNLRQRLPFKTEEEDVYEDTRVLDEQEQEQLISDLRERAAHSSKQTLVLSRIIVGATFLVHILFFFTHFLNDEPIIFTRLFALIQILVLGNNFLLLDFESKRSASSILKEVPLRPLSLKWTMAISLISPFVSFISNRSWNQIGWWAIASLVTFFVWILLQDIRSGEDSIVQLEKLKYNAKGA